jgi:hypothetical protein
MFGHRDDEASYLHSGQPDRHAQTGAVELTGRKPARYGDYEMVSPESESWSLRDHQRTDRYDAGRLQDHAPIGANKNQPWERASFARTESPRENAVERSPSRERGSSGVLPVHMSPGIYWTTPAAMICLFFAGVAFALGHHFYYLSLHGQVVNSTVDQEWATRYGTAFAFLAKTAFAAAAATAYGQHIWTTFRRETLTVAAIDAAFGVTSDLLSFFSIELFHKMTLGLFMGVIIW